MLVFMANPATKNGYLPIANELAEQFARVNITGQQWRILWVLLRKTWGFSNGIRRKDWDWISITQFEKLTGMKRANVYNTIKALLVKRLILQDKNRLCFNQNYNQWVLCKRLTPVVLCKRLTPVMQKTNGSVSQLTTYKRNKENNTKEILQPDGCKEFNSNIYIEEMLKNNKRHIVIIGQYFKIRQNNFPSLKAIQAEINRWLRTASELAEYNEEQFNNSYNFVSSKFPKEWNLSTIAKYINQIKL